MFPIDPLMKNAHDLTLAAKMVRDNGREGRTDRMSKHPAVHPALPQRFVLALAVATPIVVWLAWAVLS